MITDPQAELLTQVNEFNQVLGPIERGVAHHTSGTYYRTIYVVVKNGRNEILIQKRSTTKDLYPGNWDLSVGGHVIFGDSYEQTAIRELKEELGINANEVELIYKGEVLVTLPTSNEFFHVFEYSLKENDKITADSDEVSNTKWMNIREIKKSIREKSMEWYTRPIQVIQALY